MIPCAEVVGDPISHSLSPTIHRFWLQACGVRGRYAYRRVTASELEEFLHDRRGRSDWRGCNLTAPLKEAAVTLADRVEGDAAAIGAANCLFRDDGVFAVTNTDIDGIAEALDDVAVDGRCAIIGAGGAARAAVHVLRQHGADEVVLLVRRPDRAVIPGTSAFALDKTGGILRDVSLIVNASPLGLRGGEPMPPPLLEAVQRSGARAALDMVYNPLETPFLAAAIAGGARPIDGLTMLIGQARRSFELFFGAPPPVDRDEDLCAILSALPRS